MCAIAMIAGSGAYELQKPKPKSPKTESQIKSGLVFNFSRYMRWSTLPPAPAKFSIKVIGKDPLGTDLDKVYANRKVAKHDVSIARAGEWKDLDAIERAAAIDCQLLIVAETDPKVIAEVLNAIGTKQVVTVGFVEKFLHMGGDVEVFVESKKVRFDVAKAHLTKKSVKVSSKLLKHATTNPKSGPLPVEKPAPKPVENPKGK